MGAKKRSEATLVGRILRLPHIRKYLKMRTTNREAYAPAFIDAHIQLGENNLPNNHTFKLLSHPVSGCMSPV
jgi:hypothetical protein